MQLFLSPSHETDDDDISGLMCVPLCIPKKQDIGLRSYVEQRVKSSWNNCSAQDIKLRNSILSHRLKWETGKKCYQLRVKWMIWTNVFFVYWQAAFSKSRFTKNFVSSVGISGCHDMNEVSTKQFGNFLLVSHQFK